MILDIILLLISSALGQSQRMEWRQMQPGQQVAFIAAVKGLYGKAPGGTSSPPSQWNQEEFATIHSQYYAANHNQPGFFAWHRIFIHEYERALKAINPAVVLPYWFGKNA